MSFIACAVLGFRITSSHSIFVVIFLAGNSGPKVGFETTPVVNKSIYSSERIILPLMRGSPFLTGSRKRIFSFAKKWSGEKYFSAGNFLFVSLPAIIKRAVSPVGKVARKLVPF